jgi:hypothetical protein
MTTMPTSKPPKLPRLPDPLTPKTIEPLMKARPYWDLNHPRSPIYRRLVQRGFQIMYPGPPRRDAIGRQIDVKPLKPQHITHLVAQENREMDELERAIYGEAESGGGFDEKSRGGGENAVHVQAHARDGGKTEVSDYWRARPGEGGGEDRSDRSAGTDTGADSDSESPSPPSPPKDVHVVPDIERRADEWAERWHGTGKEQFECVGLVKTAIPEIGATPTWREGEKIRGPGDPPLEPGTAIAIFDGGRYTSTRGQSHAGIFIEYGTRDGKDGMWILDQHQDQPARRTFLSFDDAGRRPVYRAERYSVIRRNR